MSSTATTDTTTESADSAEREVTTMKKTMLTYRTLNRFEAEYITENYTAEELEQVEHAAYVANMNTCAHPEWTEADIFTDFLRVLDNHKITVSKKTENTTTDSTEREDTTMTETTSEIRDKALMLTAYERYGSVGMSEYKEMLIDELEIDKSMISDYNEYRIENGYEPYMVYDDLCEQLEGCDPSAIIKMVYFGGMRFNDDFFYFNGYGNISSCTDYEIIKEMKGDREFLAWYLDNSADVEEIDEEEAQEVINECNKMIAQGY